MIHRSCFWAASAAFLFPSSAFAQALPWDASYSASTRLTTISIQNIPAGATAANAGSFTFAPAANGAYYARAVGSVPGPLGPATVAGTATVGARALSAAIAGAVRILPAVALGSAAYSLYRAYGAYMGADGFEVPQTSENQFWTDNSNDAGTRYSSFAGLVAAKYTQAQSEASFPYRFVGYDIVSPASHPVCQNPMGAACALVKRERAVEEWDGQKMVHTGAWVPDGYGFAIKGFIGRSTDTKGRPVSLDELIALGINHSTGSQVSPDLAPVAQEALRKAPLKLTEPVPVRPDALPEPQSSPWTPSRTVPGALTRDVWKPTRFGDSIRWDKTVETKAPDGTVTEAPDPAESGSSGGGGAPAAEQTPHCETAPDSLGCMPVGEAPESVAIPTRVIDATPAPRTFGPSNAACPVGHFTIAGRSFTGLYDLFCDFLGWARYLVLGISGFIGALIFGGGVRK